MLRLLLTRVNHGQENMSETNFSLPNVVEIIQSSCLKRQMTFLTNQSSVISAA